MLAEDKECLKIVLTKFFDAPNPATDATGFANHEIVKTFVTQGIEHFNCDFLTLQERDIEALFYKESGATVPLTIFNRRCLIILLSYFHHACKQATGMIKIENVPRAKFDQYRISEYNPSVPIIPYNKKPDEEAAVSAWLKSVWPNKSDYKEFHDKAMWMRSKEQFLTTLASHGLSHLVDDKFVVENEALDTRQREWLYNVMQTVFKAPMAKTIVTQELKSRDTRVIWKKMLEYYDASMTSILRA